MLTYRNINYDNDTDEIVKLLRTSLSDNHTREFFRWKHYENPFGRSYGLLACDGNKIVGVRMFMHWVFTNEDDQVRAIRPVDTITHPDYRGMGIFKKLTLEGLEDCKNGYDLIFNTPNENSLPGYLKMGWHKYNRNLNYYLGFSFKRSQLGGSIVDIIELAIDDYLKTKGNWSTKKSKEFIQWRYRSNEYKGFKFPNDDGNSLGLIYKLMKIKNFRTIVIIEILGSKKHFKNALSKLCSLENTNFFYYLNNHSFKYSLSIKRNSSVVVLKNDENNIGEKLFFSTGDLEGKL
ncbi:GNAT family N-acetyltransferase [uncultured Christiangramia sp.]|uniref:GNAT family N-acetyltransferase n=1 Tax=uncultured Christiangramia sp. TaxID=503836 RepID=UPI00262044A2|nr:GNAT family N-acetyltransferase [uncultured Christiangramia sp.]